MIRGIYNKCKGNVGGVKAVYIAPYYKYKRSEIAINEDELKSLVKRYFFTQNVSQLKFDEVVNFDASGNESFEGTLSFSIWENQKYKGMIRKLLNKRFNFIVQLNNGTFMYLGLENGAELKSVSYQTGQSKSEMIGYLMTFKTYEEEAFFRFENLNDAGFEIVEGVSVLSSELRLLLSNSYNVLKVN